MNKPAQIMVTATTAFLNSLTADQRARVTFSFPTQQTATLAKFKRTGGPGGPGGGGPGRGRDGGPGGNGPDGSSSGPQGNPPQGAGGGPERGPGGRPGGGPGGGQGVGADFGFVGEQLGGDLTMHVHTIYRDPTNDYGVAFTNK